MATERPLPGDGTPDTGGGTTVRLNLTTDHNHHKSTPKARPENFGWKRIFLRIFLVLLLMYNRADYNRCDNNTTVTRTSDASCMQGAYNSGKPGNLREGNL